MQTLIFNHMFFILKRGYLIGFFEKRNEIGTTGRKTRVAQNILPFPTITDFRLTAIVSLSEKSTPSELKPNATTPVSSKPDRKDYGFTV